jgi:hypothetical protein
MSQQEASLVDRPDELPVRCQHCLKRFVLRVNQADVTAWIKGTLIQKAMPYLTDDERELLISETCSECWEKIAGEYLLQPISETEEETR